MAARPLLETLARRGNVAVRLDDVDECPDFAARAKVRAMPTFFVFDPEGRFLRRVEGAPNAQAFDSELLGPSDDRGH
jgi:hypothetical protein